jgi:arylsulfatase
VPIQEKIKDFFGDYEKYPHQEGSSLSVGNLGYGTLRQAELMKRLKDMETMSPP